MATKDSFNVFLRVLETKHQALNSNLEKLIIKLVEENTQAKKDAANAANQSASDLTALLSGADMPLWLTQIRSHLKKHVNGLSNAYELISAIIPLKNELEKHQWSFSENDSTPFNFDAIFEHYKNNSRLPELLSELIKALESIKESGEIDSLTMLNALGKLISTLKTSKDGSYFAIGNAWSFLMSFMNNYLWIELSKVPILGGALEALGKTIEETEKELEKINAGVKDEMIKTIEEEIKPLHQKTQMDFITYNKVGLSHTSKSSINLQI